MKHHHHHYHYHNNKKLKKSSQQTPHDDSSASSNEKTRAFKDCPSSFTLQGSTDGLYYENIYSRGGVGDWLSADYYENSHQTNSNNEDEFLIKEEENVKNKFDLKRGGGYKGWPIEDVLPADQR
jgi:hypothetical protein